MTMHRSLLALALGAAACTLPGYEGFTSFEPEDPSTSSTATTAMPTTSGASGIQTVTGDDVPQPGTSTGDSTTDAPPVWPTITDHDLSPNPITYNGPIAVHVTAADADGVRVLLDDGATIELTPTGPETFVGEIPALTGLDNGHHTAVLRAWRELAQGVPVDVDYELKLPTPGSQGFWETGDILGAGQVAAMAVLPTGDVVEFGTYHVGNSPRCYLRRRDKGGAWSDDDILDVLPGTDCSAIDLEIDNNGSLFVLLNRKANDGTRWWLGEYTAWNLGPKNLAFGNKAELAEALARHPDGTMAVCGHTPTLQLDEDAAAWIVRPGLPGETRTFDYHPVGKPPHKMWERARDCAFASDLLVLVGEVYGWHGDENLARNRLFVLQTPMNSPDVVWNVDPLGPVTQTGAQAVTVDAEGRLVIAGYACDDDCVPEGELRFHDAQNISTTRLSLGFFPTKQFAVQALAWSPAGYAVVATGGTTGNETAFTVRAFDTTQPAPLWTFARKDGGMLHMALALAIGQYGEVYAGGFGANNYPAVAYIGG